MPDPLSITTGILALIGAAWKVGFELKILRDNLSTVDGTLIALIQDVEGLQEVLEAMKETLNKAETTTTLNNTGHSGNHWRNINASLKDADITFAELLIVLHDVNKSSAFLDAPRKLLRYKSMSDRIERYKNQISSYKETLQLSLQTMIFWEQLAIRASTDVLTINMADLEVAIRKMAIEITKKLERLERLQSNESIAQSTTDVDFVVLTNLRECVRSSAVIVSSASTVLSNRRSIACESVFDDCFPPNNEDVVRWMAGAPTIYEEIPTTQIPPSVIFSDHDSASVFDEKVESDSDSDLEGELARALEKRGRDQIMRGEYDQAERNFGNCLDQLARSRKPRSTQTEVIREMLIQALMKQEKWSEAGAQIQKKLASTKKVAKQLRAQNGLDDLQLLVDVFTKAGNFSEAQLYARKLLIGYRRLGCSGYMGVESTLQSLVSICQADGNTLQQEAYASMLDVFLEESSQTACSTSSLVTVQVNSIASDTGTPSLVSDHSSIVHPALEQQPLTPMEVEQPKVLQLVSTPTEAVSTEEKEPEQVKQKHPLSEAVIRLTSDLESRAWEAYRNQGKQIRDAVIAPITQTEHELDTKNGVRLCFEYICKDLDTFKEVFHIHGPFLKEEMNGPNASVQHGLQQSADGNGSKVLLAATSNLTTHYETLEGDTNPLATQHIATEEFQRKSQDHSPSIKEAADKNMYLLGAETTSSVSNDHNDVQKDNTRKLEELLRIRATLHSPKKSNFNVVYPHDSSDLDANGESQNPTKYRKKILLLGDAAVGKTSLLRRYLRGIFDANLAPTLFETHEQEVTLASIDIHLTIYDTSGMQDHPAAQAQRRAAFARADVILLCFSVETSYALENIESIWLKEIQYHGNSHGRVPVVLVGTMSDLRDSSDDTRKFITSYKARAFADKINALGYIETSSKTGFEVRRLFEYAALESILNNQETAKSMAGLHGKMKRSILHLRNKSQSST